MWRKGGKHNLFSNQTLRRWKNYRLTKHYKNWIDLNGCQPVQKFSRNCHGDIPIDKAKLWKLTHIECYVGSGAYVYAQNKMVPIVKEVWSEYRKPKTSQARLTIFPNGDQKMMLRHEHHCPVIEIPSKNQLRALTLPRRTIQSWRRTHDYKIDISIPHRKSKNHKAELLSHHNDIEDGYRDADYELRDDLIIET